ncbi:MAG: hypothetical protein KDA98_01300, partial [Acidimicrobiales bacterium]|nr:hypothetical protein [Acidimicrobiales bacterium]
ALMDVEPMGDEFVKGMCWDIEDPTFDATATATNPRAQVRPVHRPPRVPADRHPHCAWTVTIVDDAEPLPTPPGAEALARTGAGSLPLAEAPADLPTDDGWADYAAPLDPDLVMERFSSATLARICDEVALQGHLLSHAYLTQVADLLPPADAAEVARQQAAGVAGVVAKRLAAALGVGPDLAGLAAVLEVHPLLLPRAYVDASIEADGDVLTVVLGPCPALDEPDGLGWPSTLVGDGGELVLEAIATCVAPTARVERIDGSTWRIAVPDDAEPLPQPDTVTLTEFSTGATFAFPRRA